jgi:fatty-acid desaturase
MQIRKLTTSNNFGVQLFLIIAIVISIFGILQYEFSLTSLLTVIVGYFLYGCLGVVVTYHRLLTHNSYKTYPIISRTFSLLGCFAMTGSPLAWANIHINHHLYSDKPEDPHSPLNDGLGIFMLNYKVTDKTSRLKLLVKDKFQQFLHRYYFLLLLSYGILLYMAGGLYLLVYLYLIPAVVTAVMSNIVNYVGHKSTWPGGSRTYNLRDQSTNNWIWAIPSWGESWHNNHHRFPSNFTFSEKWYQLDISGIIIRLIKTR